MANVAKYRSAGCGHLFKHFERAKELNEETGEMEYVRFRNQEIDATRTHLNYNLAPERYDENGELITSQLEILHRRLKDEDIYFRKRRDANVMCSCCLTKPKDLPANESERFFRTGYRALAERYGEDNVISAYVHRDENEDHMHFSFVPVVYDVKKERLTVSAKMKISRTDLQTLHPYLTAAMIAEFGYDVGIENGSTKEGNVTTDQLKAQTKRAEELQAKNDVLEEKNTALEIALRNAEARVSELEKKAKEYEERIAASEGVLKRLQDRFNTLLAAVRAFILNIPQIVSALLFWRYKTEYEYPSEEVFANSPEFDRFEREQDRIDVAEVTRPLNKIVSEAEELSREIENSLPLENTERGIEI